MGRQKRSANTYQKINTCFKRDVNNIIMPYDEFVMPEIELLRNIKWEATEKIDGTNIRIEVTKEVQWDDPINHNDPVGVNFSVAYRGKTDNANIPKHLYSYLEETYPEHKVLESLGLKKFIPVNEFEEHKWTSIDNVPEKYTIYGEGYGVKIQQGGNYIKDGVGFIVFDVKVNDTYLLTDSYRDIANKLGAPVVPDMGYMTIDEAIEFVRKGFKSTIAENKDYDAEGLVLKTPLGLRTRMGERIILKIKYKDFRQYELALH